MSGDADQESKTEAPTDKRLSEARKKGNNAYSPELPVLFSITAMWLCIVLLLSGAALQIAVTLRLFIDQPGMWDLRTGADGTALLSFVALNTLSAIAPLVLVLSVFGVGGSAVQFSGISVERIKPNFQRISPIAGWKRVFGLSGLAYNSRAVFKVVLVGAVAAWSLSGLKQKLLAAGTLDILAVNSLMLTLLADMARNLIGIIAVIAVGDVALVRYRWLRDLRMTKQEVKEEAKEAEGDPTVKMRLRILARQRLKKRMMAAVPNATVVVANPTHYAVALRYVRSEGGAPRIVAKGKDSLALRIRSVAEENGVPVVENRMLARALYDAVPLDASIPTEFYRAVAEIISAIMRSDRTGLGQRRNG